MPKTPIEERISLVLRFATMVGDALGLYARCQDVVGSWRFYSFEYWISSANIAEPKPVAYTMASSIRLRSAKSYRPR
jgi:hypothetical protein